MLQQGCASGQEIPPDGPNDQKREGLRRRRAHHDKIPATTAQTTRTPMGVSKRIYLHHLAATATFSQLFAKTISTTQCKQDSKTLSCYSRSAHQDKKFRPDGPNDQKREGVHRSRAHDDKISATPAQTTRTPRGCR